jgi:hypothetical protein
VLDVERRRLPNWNVPIVKSESLGLETDDRARYADIRRPGSGLRGLSSVIKIVSRRIVSLLLLVQCRD